MSTLAVTPGRVVRAEWIKFRSVRSTVVTLGSAVVVAVAFGFLFSAFGGGDPGSADSQDSLFRSLQGFNFAQLIVGVLGVLLVAGEYSTGLIRTTLAAVTTRLPVLWAKLAVYGGVTFAAMGLAAVVSFLGGQVLYSGDGGTMTLADPGVVRALVGAAVYITGIGIMGVALGFIMRNAAAAIGVLFAGLLLVPLLTGLIPGALGDTVSKLLPSNAGQALMSIGSSPDLLSPLAGFAVFVTWSAALTAGAAWLLRRRDA